MKTKYRKYHITKKICEYCGGELEINSNAQKYCEEEECRDNRYYDKRYIELGEDKYIKCRTKQG